MDGGRRNAQNEDNQQTDLLRQALENDDINGEIVMMMRRMMVMIMVLAIRAFKHV